MWEDPHESDDTLTLVDLDFRFLDRADLVVDELGKESLQTHGQLVKELQEVLLCSIREVECVLAKRDKNTHALDGVRRHRPIEQNRRLLSEEREDLVHDASNSSGHLTVGVHGLGGE